jgi:hypothetical protein
MEGIVMFVRRGDDTGCYKTTDIDAENFDRS